MNPPSLIVGLDIGTTKICTLVAHVAEDGQVDVRGVGTAPSAGLRKGVIVDVDATVTAVQTSRREAAEASGIDPAKGAVYVGVTGDHTESLDRHASLAIHRASGEILSSDVDRVKAAALNGVQDGNRDIILERPRQFIVDGREGVTDPVGMEGDTLEVDLHVVTGAHDFLDEVRRCVERADLPVDSLMLESVATGEAVTTEQDRQEGVIVMDLGGGTTDVAVYRDGALAHTAAIPVGGAHVTYDLSYGLEAPYPRAEDLKRAKACALPELCDPEAVVAYQNVRGQAVEAEHAFLAEIVGPRMEELFELVLDELNRVGIPPSALGAGAVVTGGASRLTGTTTLARRVLGTPVRDGEPHGVRGQVGELIAPEFATAVGLARIGGLDQAHRLRRDEENSLWGRMKTFWRNFLGGFD